VRGLRRKGLAGWVKAPIMVFAAVREALAVFRRRRPRAVLGMGGYAAGPGGVAAWLTRTPLLIHEQNAVPGFTNRWLLRFASQVLTGFEGTFPERKDARCVGNPVRQSIADLPPPADRAAARGGGPIHLLVLGGSQGAQVLNEIVPAAIKLLDVGLRPKVWHQAGPRTLAAAQRAYWEQGVEARIDPFIDDMAAAYAWADLAICRAGALTVAELATAGVPAVLVPYPHAVDDHQTANARHLSSCDAAVLCPQDQLTPERLAAVLEELLRDPEHLLTMANNARALSRPDAAEQVATLCLEAAK
jgi:UDP-N-acetylglucosamine--N-acetylmuramyl-(pentapeptide) pyrophosphoryl-undecaprenol N-acetylglucosamine transferase